jgi:hypothetical protein
MGEIDKQSHVLLCVLCRRTADLLYPGCGNAEGSVGKSKEDFRREYNGQEAAALPNPVSVCVRIRQTKKVDKS